jgi:chromosome segregation ATPase
VHYLWCRSVSLHGRRRVACDSIFLSKTRVSSLFDSSNMSHHVFENQYKKTKERAERFSSSLYKAKEQEELFEEERQQWVHSFEEKSAIIEQLERELTSTVDALDKEKRERTVLQKELIHTTWDNKSSRDPKFNPKSYTEHNDSINSRQNYPVTTRSNPRHDQSDEFEKSGKRVLELLQQSQDETNRAKKEIMSIRLERDQLSEQIVIVRRQYERDSDEKEKLAQSLRLSEGDVVLRDRQV